MAYSAAEIDRAAQAIAVARNTRAEIALPDGLPPLERDDAYRVQTRVNELLMPPGATVAGFKVSGMQKASGDRPKIIVKPLVAPLWAHRVHASGVALDGRQHRTLGLETEVCLRLGVHGRGDAARYEIVGALPSFELVERRQGRFATAADVNLMIADSIANVGIILGEERAALPGDILDTIASISRNGEVVLERRIGDRLEDPRQALDVLKAALADMDWVVPDGALLLTGLLTTELWLEPGDVGVGVIGSLGTVSASLQPQ